MQKKKEGKVLLVKNDGVGFSPGEEPGGRAARTSCLLQEKEEGKVLLVKNDGVGFSPGEERWCRYFSTKFTVFIKGKYSS